MINWYNTKKQDILDQIIEVDKPPISTLRPSGIASPAFILQTGFLLNIYSDYSDSYVWYVHVGWRFPVCNIIDISFIDS